MSRNVPSNLAASVRQRLLNLSRARREDFNLLLTRYGVERCLYRLSKTDYAKQFTLKGAMLFRAWTHEMHRQTVDLDLLSYGDPSTERLRQIFEDICEVNVEPDGLEFSKKSITVTAIREDDEYHGQRVVMQGSLGKMSIPLQVDIGFGDAVHVEQSSEYPTLLDFPAPQIKMYPKEYMISEKLHAMVILVDRNSRMKDFHDLWFMSRNFSFEGPALMAAIVQTFDRRKTALPRVTPAALLKTFSENPVKAAQWQSFLKRNRLEEAGDSLEKIIPEISRFLVPPLLAGAEGERFQFFWQPGGPWVEKAKRDRVA